MEISIREYRDSDLIKLNYLLQEVYQLKRNGNSNEANIELVALDHDMVVGYLILNKLYDNIQNINYGHINYVCVLEQYRNLGIATQLFQKVFELCKNKNIVYLELTSNQSRIAAHHLYKKLGFDIRKTNVFRKEFI